MAVLPLFKSLPVADVLHHTDRLPEPVRSYARDTVTLGWEDRVKARARRRSDLGLEFATALPRGTVLRQDDCLVFDAPPLVIRVIERHEPVLVVRPVISKDRALWAYHIGNSHQPLMVTDTDLVCPDSPEMEQVLTYHAIPFERDTRPFTPAGQGAGHQHAPRV